MLIAELLLKTDSREMSFEMYEGRPLFAGRTMECDIHLPAPAVSRRHAVFMAKGGKCGIKDLESSNGTYLNGNRLEKPMRLKNGDVVQIANFTIEFRMAQMQSYARASDTVIIGKDGIALPTPKPAPVAPAASVAPKAPAPPLEFAPPPAVSMPTVSMPTVPLVPDTPADGEGSEIVESDHFEDVEHMSAMPVASPDRKMSDTSVRVKPAKPPVAEPAEDANEADTTIDTALQEKSADVQEEPAPEPESEADPEPEAVPEPEPESAPEPEAEAEPDPEPAPAVPAKPNFRPPPPPPTPRLEKLDEPSEDEIGDGDGDSAIVVDSASDDDDDKEMKLAKAAAEAGLMGEFAPDVPEPTAADARASGQGVSLPTFSGDFPPPPEPDPYAIPIGDDFRQAIEARLYLYAFLSDLKTEREAILAANPALPDAGKSEIDRQNREMDKMPAADRAEDMISKRTAKRDELKAKIKEAKAKGAALPPRPSKDMRALEDIAINQWTIIAKSQREALPAVFEAGYRITGREPLAKALEEAKIDAKSMLGSAAYLLALAVLLEEAKYNRAYVKAKLAALPPPDDKKGGKKKAAKKVEEEEEEEAEEPGESYEELAATELQLASRVAWITQESATLELATVKDYWEVYTKTALAFLPGHEKMPMPVRAFMRHGVVGFQKWWLKEDVRAHVIEDCTNNVRHVFEISKTVTNVVYADEYLAAVMEMQCTPAMDENLEINERNSPNWKADKALRKLINSRSQTALLTELADSLGERIDKMEAEASAIEDRISKLLPGSKNFKGAKNELGQQRQAFKIEVSKLTKLRDKLRDETLANLKEVIEETEARFASGELPKPTRDFLITRECDAVRKIGRLLANLKERFMPLVMRENFHPNTDAVNDRDAILGEFADIERRDPSIFLENIIPSKKKAGRVDLRVSPAIVLLPSAGTLAFSWNPRQKPEDGRLGIPTCFIRPRLRERQLMYLLSDFRWDTAKAAAGMDVMNSDTIVAAFMGVRWDWRKRSKEGREKGLIYSDQNDRTNWRRVYEAYMSTAYDGGKKLYQRNYDFYERIIGKYFDMPEGVELLRK